MHLSNGLFNGLDPPVVAFPDFTVPFSLYTDDSGSAIGAVLVQRQGDQEKVVASATASHVLTKAERKWSTYDRELWAIVWALRHFLYKQPFVIVTDHKPLLGLRKIPIDNDRTGRCACWALELDPFEWTVIHKDGHSHLNADAMSHRPADIRPTELSTFFGALGNPHSDKRHSNLSLSSLVSFVHHSLCSTDTNPVYCNLTGPQPPPASSHCVS